MPNKTEKKIRKQLLKSVKAQQHRIFEQSLPMSRTLFSELFNYLDNNLENDGCDDTLKLTKQFLQHANVVNAGEVLLWLSSHSGYCDCEVLANVEEQFNS